MRAVLAAKKDGEVYLSPAIEIVRKFRGQFSAVQAFSGLAQYNQVRLEIKEKAEQERAVAHQLNLLTYFLPVPKCN